MVYVMLYYAATVHVVLCRKVNDSSTMQITTTTRTVTRKLKDVHVVVVSPVPSIIPHTGVRPCDPLGLVSP
ncbi:hypothetical protein B0T19DRAFT_422926 [Cercophora scortea]|uniref:Uncharacterized protein n=1 Tax=Cercophora scortea TaxID=314031 RepID=A0AAE0INX5_9PEZI|nr:hypothetical protein B0T19DRAFT_422926 [Cercophora scortea]